MYGTEEWTQCSEGGRCHWRLVRQWERLGTGRQAARGTQEHAAVHSTANRSKRQRPGPKRQQSYGLEQIFFACTGESRAVVYSAVSFSGFSLTRAPRGVGRGNDDQ